MKVKEGLVYNKSDGKVIGYTAINDELMKMDEEEQKPVAKQILVLMVRGTMFNLTFPYAHFGTKGSTADLLYPIIWIAIRRLEDKAIKVISVTADGASPTPTSTKLEILSQSKIVGCISLQTHPI